MLDVTDATAVHDVVDRSFTSLGRIDVVVSNAGQGLFGAAEELSDEQVTSSPPTSPALSSSSGPACRTRAPRAAGGSSRSPPTAGRSPSPATRCTTPRNGGIEGFAESVAREVAPFGIGVTIVEPGGARTEFRYGSAQAAEPLPAYDGTPAHGFLAMLNPANGLAPGDPARMAATIIASAAQEPAPMRMILGAQAPKTTVGVLKDRIASFEARADLAARQTSRLANDQYPAHRPAVQTEQENGDDEDGGAAGALVSAGRCPANGPRSLRAHDAWAISCGMDPWR
jgi:hypothetical protein